MAYWPNGKGERVTMARTRVRAGVVSCPDYVSLGGKIVPISFWFQCFEITVMSHHLDYEFINGLVNSEL